MPEFPRDPLKQARLMLSSTSEEERLDLASLTIIRMRCARLVPVSPSGTGNTLMAFNSCSLEITSLAPARIMWNNVR
ncbi:hypothetical protein D3C85_1434610 [compost metagenome]